MLMKNKYISNMKRIILLAAIAMAVAGCKKETYEDKLYKYEVTLLDSAVQVYNPTSSDVKISITLLTVGDNQYSYIKDYTLMPKAGNTIPFSTYSNGQAAIDSIIYNSKSKQACIFWEDENAIQPNTNYSRSCSK